MCVIYCWENLNWRLGACEPLFTRESPWIKYSLLNFWNFAKKNIKICKKKQILDLEKKPKKFWKSRKSQKHFWNFSIGNRIENRKIENFKISKFSIFNTIFNGKFSKIFSRFSKILRFFRFRIFVGNQEIFNFFWWYFFKVL